MPCQFSLGYVGAFEPGPVLDAFSENSFGHHCQFTQFNESDLIVLDGKKWCPFHLPLIDSAGNATVKKSWNLEAQAHYGNLISTYIWEQKIKEKPIDLCGLVHWDRLSFAMVYGEDLSGAQTVPCENIPALTLDGAYFPRGVDFSNLHFAKKVYARNVTFGGPADFIEIHFSDDADFSDSQFQGDANFALTQFYKKAIFRGAQFNKKLDFTCATFKDIADFSLNNYYHIIESPSQPDAALRIALFNGANFLGLSRFNDRIFSSGPHFMKALFSIAPEFHNSTFHQSVNFDGAKFSGLGYPTADHAYRTLKLAMEKLGARDEQTMFFALEQQARARKFITPKSIKFFSHLYGLTSDYGQSFVRPLLWLSLAAIFFGFIYTINLLSLKSDPSLSFYFIANFTLEQLTRPFLIWAPDSLVKLGISSNPAIGPTGAELTLKIFSTLHTLISIGLFTLTLLALRRRFKLD